VVFPALSLEPSQLCSRKVDGLWRCVQSEEKKFRMLQRYVSLRSVLSCMLMPTLFISPSEDRTSQTMMMHQLIPNYISKSSDFRIPRGGCGGVILMHCLCNRLMAANLGDGVLYVYYWAMARLLCEGVAGVVFGCYTRENGGLFRIVYLHLAHVSKALKRRIATSILTSR
jgi:hypothetical protein